MRNLHAHGGLVLESLWRGHDTVAIFNALAKRGVDLFFVVGGYGTIRGATKIADEVALRNLPITVAVIPKTTTTSPSLIRPSALKQDAICHQRCECQGGGISQQAEVGQGHAMGQTSGFLLIALLLNSKTHPTKDIPRECRFTIAIKITEPIKEKERVLSLIILIEG